MPRLGWTLAALFAVAVLAAGCGGSHKTSTTGSVSDADVAALLSEPSCVVRTTDDAAITCAAEKWAMGVGSAPNPSAYELSFLNATVAGIRHISGKKALAWMSNRCPIAVTKTTNAWSVTNNPSCKSARSSKPSRPQEPAPARPQTTSRARPAGCITTGGYGGLYSTVSAFNSQNNTNQQSGSLLGVAVYHVLSTSHGCVTSYSVDERTRPPQSASDIVFLTEGISLPPDSRQVSDAGSCVVLSSSTLKNASGSQYAVAQGTAQSGSIPAHAEIDLTNSGSC